MFSKLSYLLLGLVFPATLIGTSGCQAARTVSAPTTVQLEITNASNYEIEDLYITASTDYQQATSLLSSPLASNDSDTVTFPNNSYVTVTYKNVEGFLEAFTTEAPVEVSQDGCELLVFDDSFRLLDSDIP